MREDTDVDGAEEQEQEGQDRLLMDFLSLIEWDDPEEVADDPDV